MQGLATKMFKIHRGLSSEIIRETSVSKTSSCNLRRNDTFEKRQGHSVYHGTELLSFLCPKLWDLVPVELKQSESLDSFKLKIKNWVLPECSCRLCKTYRQKVGFPQGSIITYVYCYCYYHFYHLRLLLLFFGSNINIYLYICICVYAYICIYREREKERDR